MKYLIVLALFVFSLNAVSAQVYIPKFDLQGHRGARGLMPENSIPAFLLALDSGVTTIELDLAVTKDQQLVVSHEPWMSAAICLTADGTAITSREEKNFNIFRMDYAEVARFDCGSIGNEKFPEQHKVKVAKPLLRDVIISVENHIKDYLLYEVDYNIEIKSSPAGDDKFHPAPAVFSDLVFNLLDQYLPMERVVIQSFDFRVLKYWREKYPAVRLSALVENTRPAESNLNSLGFDPSIYSPHFRLLSKEAVDNLHARQIRVIPWTVNETDDMKHMLKLGVDGFITDYPDRAARLGLGIKKLQTPPGR